VKTCIVGAGAGFIGTRLAASGRAEVSAIARGATLAALKEHGWRMREGGALLQAPAIGELIGCARLSGHARKIPRPAAGTGPGHLRAAFDA
jgi:hypothetical protein